MKTSSIENAQDLVPDIELDATSGELLWKGRRHALRPKTLSVLRFLVDRPGQVVSMEALREAVWGRPHGSENGPKQCIRELRSILDEATGPSRHIETVGRHGYRLIMPIALAGEARSIVPASTLVQCVGRSRELAKLDVCFAAARKGVRQVHLLAGEPGAGKTTVTSAFVARCAASRDLWIVRGQCTPMRGPHEPYGPLLEIAEQLAAGPLADTVIQLIKSSAPSWISHLPSVFGEKQAIGWRGELAGSSADRLLREFTTLIERLADKSPGLIVLEDLHWADSNSVAWICAWMLRQAPSRVMILGTVRPGDLSDSTNPMTKALDELQRRSGFSRTDLPGLKAEAVSTYLGGMFRERALPDFVAIELARRTDGHPIFVEALVRDWLTSGVLRQISSECTLDDVGFLFESMPPSARGLIENQIAQLSESERRALEVASVAGTSFSAALMAHDLSAVAAHEQTYESLARRQLFVRRSGDAEWPDGTTAARYEFRHALYQQALYGALPAATRRNLHMNIGLQLEQAYGARSSAIAAPLMEHFERGGDAFRCAHYNRLVAESALSRRAAKDAARHLERAAALLSSLPESRKVQEEALIVQLALGLSLMVGNGIGSESGEAAYGRARRLSEALGDSNARVRALRGQWEHYIRRGNLAATREIAREVQASIPGLSNAEQLMWAHNMLGQTHWIGGQLVSAQSHISFVSQHYDVHQHGDFAATTGTDPGTTCHAYGTIVCQLMGLSEESAQHFKDGLAIAQTLNRPFATAEMLWTGCIAAREAENAELVRERAASMFQVCQRADITFWSPANESFAGWAAVMLGDASGLELLTRTLRLDRNTSSGFRAYRVMLYAEALLACAREQEAAEVIERGFDFVAVTGERWFLAELHRVRSRIRAKSARLDPHLALEDAAMAIQIATEQEAKAVLLKATATLQELQAHVH